MVDHIGEQNLANQRYVTLIVRLRIDDHGELLQGELTDDTRTFQQRFVGRSGLLGVLHAWLAQLARGEHDDRSPS